MVGRKSRRKSVWTTLGKHKPDKLNKEGFPAFSGDEKVDVVNVLMTGSTANSFYASAESKVADIVDVLMNVSDVEFLAKATVYARQHGYVREIPIASTVVLSVLDVSLFKTVVHEVCRNPKDWQKLIDIARSGVIRGGVGRAIKREIIRSLSTMEPYHVAKYPKAVEDMINIARPNERVNPVAIKYIKEREPTHPLFHAIRMLRECDNDAVVARIIREHGIPYEVATGTVRKMTPKIWEALLYVAPYFNLLRNLRNFYKNGVFENTENLDYAVKKLTNKKEVGNSKLYPFRFLVAHKMLEFDRYGQPFDEVVVTLQNAVSKAAELSIDNIPQIDGRVCIAPDISGSMDSKVLGEHSIVRCINIVGMFTSLLLRKCKEVPVVLPFNHEIDFSLVDRLMEESASSGNLLQMAELFYASGGTSLSAPVEYLLQERVEVDRFIGITDNEEWVGRNFIEALSDYRRRVNPDVEVYLITLMPYRDYPTPTYMDKVHYVFGWSDRVLDYVASDVKSQIKQIEEINF